MRRRVVSQIGRYLLLLLLFLADVAQSDQSASLLKVGIYNNPPLVTTNQSGNPGGLFIEILEEIASQEGWKLHYVAGTWSDNLQRLSTGKIDLLPAIAINPARQQQFIFTEQSLVSSWAQIFVPEESPIQSLPDLDGKRIAVLRDDVYVTGENGFKAICESFLVVCDLIEFDTYDRVLRAVAQGNADAGLVNRLFGATRGHIYPTIASPIVLMPQDIRLAISPKSPIAAFIRKRLDHHLAIMKIDDLSVYQQNLKTLFRQSTRTQEMTPRWVLQTLLMSGLVIIVLLVVAQVLSLKHSSKSQKLISQAAQYHQFFNGVAIALCEGDSSRALIKLQQLIDSGVEDIRGYFNNHPQEIADYIRLIRVINANPATLRLFAVDSLHQLQRWLPGSYTPDFFTALKEFLIASSEKKNQLHHGNLHARGRW